MNVGREEERDLAHQCGEEMKKKKKKVQNRGSHKQP